MASHIFISIDGQEFTTEAYSLIMSVSIRDASGETADTAEIMLDDSEGQIPLPEPGQPVVIEISRDDVSGAGVFEGFVDDVSSRGSRGDGMVLVIGCKSADMRSELKSRRERHKDDASFEEAAKAFAPKGITVKMDGELGKIQRDYWCMGREHFMHWAERTARELGATFKVVNKTAVFVPRNSGKSASGQSLETVNATLGQNLIAWDVSPDRGRPQREGFEVTWYDPKEAKWKTQDGSVKRLGEGTVGTARFSAPDQESAQQKAKAMEKETDREKGGGSVTVDGNPAAQAEATLTLTVRDGISGEYRIDSVEHRITRAEGFVTVLELKQPGEGAGKDSRSKKKRGGSSGGQVIDGSLPE